MIPESLIKVVKKAKPYPSICYDIITLLKAFISVGNQEYYGYNCNISHPINCPLQVLPFYEFGASINNSFARKTGLTTQTFVIMTFILELLLLILLGKPYSVLFFWQYLFHFYKTLQHHFSPKKCSSIFQIVHYLKNSPLTGVSTDQAKQSNDLI